MSLLLDTHAAVWWWCVPEKFGAGMLEQLKHPSTVVVFSAVSAFRAFGETQFDFVTIRRRGEIPGRGRCRRRRGQLAHS